MIFGKRINSMILLVFFPFLQGYTQEDAVKDMTPVFSINSNLLYDVATGMNLGVEWKMSENFTFKLPTVYNPWSFEDNKKFKFIFVQPELRWWFCEPFSGHFFGFHGHYAFFNVAGIGTAYMKERRFQGSLYGGGIAYGYQFYLSPRWNLEASIGIGYAYMNYNTYYCETCGEFIKTEEKYYFGPTQAGISLIYIIK